MKLGKVSRRRFLLASIVCAPLALVADAKWLEPDWVKIRRIRLGSGKPPQMFITKVWFTVPIRFNCRPEITVFEL